MRLNAGCAASEHLPVHSSSRLAAGLFAGGLGTASVGMSGVTDITDAQRDTINEMLSRPPTKPKGPSRPSQEDLPLRRSAESHPDLPDAERTCLFTTNVEEEVSEEVKLSRRSGASPPKPTFTKGGALPLPANRTRYYQD